MYGITLGLKLNNAPFKNAITQSILKIKDLNKSLSFIEKLVAFNLGGQILNFGSSTLAKPLAQAIEFEDALASFNKVASLNKIELKQMSEELSTLGASFGKSSIEALEMAASASQLGIAKNDILKFVETSSKMALAFDIDAKSAANSMAKMMAQFSYSFDSSGIEQVATLGDYINNLSNNMNATAKDITEVLTKTAGLGKIFGLQDKNIAGFAASFLHLGIAPDIAGTALKNFTTRLQAVSGNEKLQKSFEEILSLDFETFKTKMKQDGEGSIKDLLKSISKLDNFEQTNFIKDFFGLEIAGPVATLATTLGEYEKALKGLKLSTGDILRGANFKALELENFTELLKSRPNEAITDLFAKLSSVDLNEQEALLSSLFEASKAKELLTTFKKMDSYTKALNLNKMDASGSLNEEAATKLNTTKIKLAELQNHITNITTSLGLMLLPLASFTADFLNTHIEATKKILKYALLLSPVLFGAYKVLRLIGFQKVALIAYSSAHNLKLLATRSIMLATSGAAFLINKALLISSVILGALRKGMILFNLICLKNPLGLMIAGVVAGVGLLITGIYYLIKLVNPLLERFGQGFGGEMLQTIETIATKAKDFINPDLTQFQELQLNQQNAEFLGHSQGLQASSISTNKVINSSPVINVAVASTKEAREVISEYSLYDEVD